MTEDQISRYEIGQIEKSAFWADGTRDSAPREHFYYEGRIHRPYPIKSVSRDEAANFVSRIDDEARAARFGRYLSRNMASSHYRTLDPDSTVLFGWVEDGEILGLSEGLIYVGRHGAQAEIVLTVPRKMGSSGILKPLLARAVSALSYRGVAHCHLVLGRQDCLEARAVCELGGTVDWDAEIASISADVLLKPSFAAFC
jgi:hypothetical protein